MARNSERDGIKNPYVRFRPLKNPNWKSNWPPYGIFLPSITAKVSKVRRIQRRYPQLRHLEPSNATPNLAIAFAIRFAVPAPLWTSAKTPNLGVGYDLAPTVLMWKPPTHASSL